MSNLRDLPHSICHRDLMLATPGKLFSAAGWIYELKVRRFPVPGLQARRRCAPRIPLRAGHEQPSSPSSSPRSSRSRMTLWSMPSSSSWTIRAVRNGIGCTGATRSGISSGFSARPCVIRLPSSPSICYREQGVTALLSAGAIDEENGACSQKKLKAVSSASNDKSATTCTTSDGLLVLLCGIAGFFSVRERSPGRSVGTCGTARPLRLARKSSQLHISVARPDPFARLRKEKST